MLLADAWGSLSVRITPINWWCFIHQLVYFLRSLLGLMFIYFVLLWMMSSLWLVTDILWQGKWLCCKMECMLKFSIQNKRILWQSSQNEFIILVSGFLVFCQSFNIINLWAAKPILSTISVVLERAENCYRISWFEIMLNPNSLWMLSAEFPYSLIAGS